MENSHPRPPSPSGDPRLVVAGVAVAGRAALLADVGRVMRLVRSGLIAVTGIGAALAHHDGWTGGSLPLWVAALAPPAVLLAVNALSLRLDASVGQGQRRQRLETAADVAAVIALGTVLAPLVGEVQISAIVVVVLVGAALRLAVAEALGAAVTLHLGIVSIRALDPFPWPVAPPGFAASDLTAQAIAALLVVWLVASSSRQVHGSRDQVALLAGRQELLNAQLSRANADLASAYEVLATRTDEVEDAHAEARTLAAEERRARDDYERFAALVAHDLASPLATLKGIAATLQRVDFDDDARQALLRSALNTATRASALVDRLHAHARAGAATLEPEDIELAVIAAGVVADHGEALRATGSSIVVDERLPEVRCDRLLAGQLLSNLVSNALRHGADERGVAHVRITATRVGTTVAIAVSDQGPGIDPAIAADLFTTGVRGKRSRGLGLGMGTSRTIAERHGGTIEVVSGPLGGTVATFTLPSAGRRTVLLVEGDDELRHFCKLRIANADDRLDVLEARSVAEAVHIIGSIPAIDAAIVDVDLPDGTGLDLLADLTRLAIPVQVVAERTCPESRRTARQHGFTIGDLASFVDAISTASVIRALP